MRQKILGVFGEIDSLPGCSQIAVSHSVFAPEEIRGFGVGQAANLQRKNTVFNDLGYDGMICTVDANNHAQCRILFENGWQMLKEFQSSKTGHTVQLWMITKG